MIYLACYLTAAIVQTISFYIDPFNESIFSAIIEGFLWPIWIIGIPAIMLYEQWHDYRSSKNS